MWLPRQNHAIKWPQPCVTILRQFFTQTFDFFFVHFNFCRILLRDVPHPVWMHGSNTLKRTSSSASSWSSNCESVPKKKSQHSSRHRLRCIDDFVHSLKSHFNWKSFFNCYFYSNPNSTFIFTRIQSESVELNEIAIFIRMNENDFTPMWRRHTSTRK